MGDRERSSKLPSWCCGYTEQSQRALGPHREGLRQEWRGALSLPFPQLFGLGLASGMEGVCGPYTVCSEGPQLACSMQSPSSQAWVSSFGGGACVGVQHCFQKGPVEMQSCYLGTVVYGQLSPLRRAGRWMTEDGTALRLGVGDVLMGEKGCVGRAFSGGCSACGDT